MRQLVGSAKIYEARFNLTLFNLLSWLLIISYLFQGNQKN